MLRRKGFTLIELLIVIIIVGVLAAVSVPMMQANVEKAKKTEAISALGSIRTAERLHYAENKAYANVANFGAASHALDSYITGVDLDGRYFINACYSVDNAGEATMGGFRGLCNSANSGTAESNGLSNVIMYGNGQYSGF